MKSYILFIAMALAFAACKNTSESENTSLANLPEYINSYLEISDALIKDNPSKAKEAATEMKNKIQNSGMNEEVETTLSAIASTDDIEMQRTHFAGLSKHIIAHINDTPVEGATLYVYYCPMALNNQGAEWLSSTKKISNPYMGASMPECGEVKQTITN